MITGRSFGLRLVVVLVLVIEFVKSQADKEEPAVCNEFFTSKGCKFCTKHPSSSIIKCAGCGPQMFYNTQVQECQNCLSGCLKCTNLASCDDCLFGYFRVAANETQKSLGYKHACKSCQVANCMNCTDETTCNFCSVGYTLNPEKPGTCKYRVEEWVSNAKNTAWIVMIILFVICLVIIGGVVGWFYWEKKKEAEYLAAQERAKRNRELNRLPPNLQEEEGTITDRANRRPNPNANSNDQPQSDNKIKTPDSHDIFGTKPKVMKFEVSKQNLNDSSKMKTLDNIDQDL